MAAGIPAASQPPPPLGAWASFPPGTPTGILVVDDHELVRLGFRALLQAQAQPASPAPEVFEAQTLADALALYAAHLSSIGVVLLDLALPDAGGLSGLVAFRDRFPGARIVVLSGTTSEGLKQGALALGASAFLSKSGDLSDVLRFIRDGGVFAAPQKNEQASAPQHLSPRQAEILELIVAGRSNREIAQLTHLSEGTVKNHVSTLLLMFGMRSRAYLISSLR